MNLDKTIIKRRSAQIVILIAAVTIYLVFGHLIPAYEKIPYYTSKIAALKKEKARLEVTREHFGYYQQKAVETASRLANYQAHFNELAKPATLQNQLNSLYHTTGLEVISQQFNTEPTNPDLTKIVIFVTLNGTYDQLADFIKKSTTMDRFVFLSECELINQSPLASNPPVTMNAILTLYLPKTS